MHEEISIDQVVSRILNAQNRSIKEEDAMLLISHLRFVLDRNKVINLTKIDSETAGLLLHIEDSLAALPELDQANYGELADLGSGGGFPGIPLAVVSGRKTTLIEATMKKAKVLSEFVSQNSLDKQIEIAAMRIEELARIKSEHYVVATARALSSLPSLMELAAPLLVQEGILIAYKGKVSDTEITKAKELELLLGMRMQKPRSFLLSDEKTTRTIITFRKTGSAKIELPRRAGQAQHNPLP